MKKIWKTSCRIKEGTEEEINEIMNRNICHLVEESFCDAFCAFIVHLWPLLSFLGFLFCCNHNINYNKILLKIDMPLAYVWSLRR